jgi:uncharacterized protein YjbI with pentapeptide repeats
VGCVALLGASFRKASSLSTDACGADFCNSVLGNSVLHNAIFGNPDCFDADVLII